ncbi:MAG: ANTAR domain-containing protein [Rhodospirillales bacterium]
MRVLLADDNAERAGALARVLAADPGIDVVSVPKGELLADAVAALAPDIVLVDMARPDRDALDGIRQVTARDPHPIVLFVDEDDPAFMEEAIGAGVSSYNVLGVPPPDVKPILRAATALFRRHQQARDGQTQAETQLKEREIVDRAKAILIRERRLGEPEAYRWLRKQAMTSGKRIADVARTLVREKEGAAP